MNLLTPLPTPNDLIKAFPLASKEKNRVSLTRTTCEHLLRGEDDRLVIFVGPCSIHDPKIALDYASNLKDLSKKVEERVFLVMRVFLEKPRTQFGWKGYLYDPLLDGSDEIAEGLHRSRELLLKLVQIDVPIATEFLDPILPAYTQDLVSWGIVGARTSSSQVHRQMASHLPMPIGFKNETDGTIDNAICAALSARHAQASIGIDEKGQICSMKTSGNPYTHVVLRGSQTSANYDHLSIHEAIRKQRLYGLNFRLLIDCAHGNSQKDPQKQQEVFINVLEQIQEGNDLIMGLMLESHLQGGNALSLTDPCLDWTSTEKLILCAYQSLPQTYSIPH